MARRSGNVLGGVVVLLAAAFPWQVCAVSGEPAERAPRAYEGYRCPFDPHGLTGSTLEQQLKALHAFERRACVLQSLYETDPQVRTVALRALGESFPRLAAVIVETGQQLSRSADGRGQQATFDDVVAELVRRISEVLRSGGDKRTAAQLLGLLGHPSAVAALSECLDDPDPNIRRDVIVALRNIQDPAALEPLIRATRDPHLGYEAVPGVAAIGGPRAREALLEIMGSWRLDANLRLSAARELRVSGDPVAVAAAERYLASLRPQWQRAFYFAVLMYYLAFMASRLGSSRWWTGGLYAVAVGSILFLINPMWLFVGEEKAVFWGLAIGYPLGLGAGVFPIRWALRRFGRQEAAGGMGKLIFPAVLAMWGTLGFWVVAVYVWIIIGIVVTASRWA